MSLDPREDIMRAANPDPLVRLAAKLAELERRLDAQRNGPVRSIGAGPPTIAAADGAIYLDSTNNRFYVRLLGAWRFVALT